MGLFSGIGQSLKNLSFTAKINEEYFEELEEQLILADVGVDTATKMTAALRETARKERLTQADQLRPVLIKTAESILESAKTETPTENPRVILVVGVNGAGKTTTIGKLSARYAFEGKRVILAAADTFRAAATEQLGIWAARTGAEMITHSQGADPAAVVCDAIRAAMARKADVVLCDTAGRLHNKRNLMDELSKIRRVIARELPGCVPEVLLVVDATTGQNGLAQAKSFRESY
jgi:fused signal recognition particle receptor